MSQGDDGKNSNVTAGGWVNRRGSADSWISPLPDIGSGNINGVGPGVPPSPQGGIWAGGWANGNASPECFSYDIVGLLEVGVQYDVKFYQIMAGCKGGGHTTPIGELAQWRVELSNGLPIGGSPQPIAGAETHLSPEMDYKGPSNQVWEEATLRFTAANISGRLQFCVQVGSDGRGPSYTTDLSLIHI